MRTRWIALALALVGAAALALSSIEPWWYAGEATIGPYGTHHCFGGDCQSTGLTWLGGTDLWMRTAIATRAAAILATIILVVLAGALAAGRVPKLVAKTVLSTALCAVLAGGYFVAKFPPLGGESIGVGPILFAGGLVAALVAAVLVLRLPATTGDRSARAGRGSAG
ncbi:MAG: hypothetical protein JO257_21840 [Deltaproteobacteria bacterium]|nr:hypothetical protein [Deltaproteobacteria bacterium]